MKDKNYKSLGYCIFCLDQALPPRELTEEHIIANALGGTLRFKEAACRQCAEDMNKRFEQPSLTADFLVPRLLLQLRAKGKTTNNLPPVSFDSTVFTEHKLSGFDTLLSREEYPRLLQFLAFTEPGKIIGIDYREIEPINHVRVVFSNISYAFPEPQEPYEMVTQTTVQPYEFGMSIVKIAYAFAVAECGINAFDGTEIRELLADKRQDLFNFFGSLKNISHRRMHHLHHLSWIVEKELLIVKVHLFASYGAAPYIVVVGKHISFNAKK